MPMGKGKTVNFCFQDTYSIEKVNIVKRFAVRVLVVYPVLSIVFRS